MRKLFISSTRIQVPGLGWSSGYAITLEGQTKVFIGGLRGSCPICAEALGLIRSINEAAIEDIKVKVITLGDALHRRLTDASNRMRPTDQRRRRKPLLRQDILVQAEGLRRNFDIGIRPSNTSEDCIINRGKRIIREHIREASVNLTEDWSDGQQLFGLTEEQTIRAS